MADTSVTERRIRPIQDAYAAGNLKQALKDCEKWQKKGESSDIFLALKATVLASQPDLKSQEKGKAEALQLCDRKQPITNIEAIYQLQDAFKILALDGQETSNLWERAVLAKPSDEKLLTTWLNDSIATSKWQSAQKAAMALKKAFPKERQYEYWNILMCFLIHEDDGLLEKDRKLFGMLAYRMITKAAQSSQLSSTEELSLLASVILGTGNAAELVQMLQGEALHAVVDLDPVHSRSLLLQAISKSNDQDVMSSYCEQTLFGAERDETAFDDERIWRLCTRSATSETVRKSRLSQIENVLVQHPKCRQALLAKLDVLLQEGDQSMIAEACKEYYQLYSSKAFCFDDLIGRLQSVSPEFVSQFSTVISSATDSASPASKLFVLKLDYSLLRVDQHAITNTIKFTISALDLCKETRIEQGAIAADAALLTALTLLRLAASTAESSYTAQASLVLQTATKLFPDNFALRVLLLQVQTICGQISLAMSHFLGLSVKNIQWETTGHLLLTRISTLHPWQHGKGDVSLNPLGALDTAISVFEKSQQSLNKSIQDGLKYNSYSNILDTIPLRARLQRSLVHQLYTIEERKCQRVWGVPVDVPPSSLPSGPLVDFRDLAFMPSFGVKDNDLTALLERGPPPGTNWVATMHIQELITSYITLSLTNDSDKSHTLEHIRDAINTKPASTADLTPDETNAYQVYIAIYNIAATLSNTPASAPAPPASTDEPLQQIKTWLEKCTVPSSVHQLNTVQYPDWSYLHAQFTALETLQSITSFAALLLKKSKTGKSKNAVLPTNLKDSALELQKTCLAAVDRIHAQVREVKAGLNAGGVLGRLVDGVLGRAEDEQQLEAKAEKTQFSESLQELVDEVAVEEYCGAIRDSWEDALDGILSVKIKVPK